MKQLFLSLAVASAALFCFSSCSNDDETVNPTQARVADLRIETEISTAETGLRSTRTGSLSRFSEGSALSLFVTNGTWGNNYPLVPQNNIKAEYQSGKWQLSPAVKLDERPATVFAFYPYNASYTNATPSIEINHASTNGTQVDYMYGTHAPGQYAITWNNPGVRLQMKHALSLLQFKVRKSHYEGEGRLTRIEVANANAKTDLASTASIDVSTGELSSLGGYTTPASIYKNDGLYTLTDNEPTDEKDFMDVMVVPVNKVNADGNISIRFYIDGKEYTYPVPANTAWKQGVKYIYQVTVSATGLVIDDITIAHWEPGTGGDINLY